MKRRKRRGKSGTPSGQGSKFDQWFAASTKPPSGDVLASRPARWRKTTFSTGQLSTATRTYSQLGRGGRAIGAQDRGVARVAARDAALTLSRR